mgnify:CR=1 FL=1
MYGLLEKLVCTPRFEPGPRIFRTLARSTLSYHARKRPRCSG